LCRWQKYFVTSSSVREVDGVAGSSGAVILSFAEPEQSNPARPIVKNKSKRLKEENRIKMGWLKEVGYA
jgi:hypothetical protein